MFELTDDAIVIIDSDDVVVTMNRIASVLFGYEAEELIGLKMSDYLVPEGLRRAHRAGLERFLHTQSGQLVGNEIKLTGLHSSGREFALEAKISIMRLKDNCYFAARMRPAEERTKTNEETEANNSHIALLIQELEERKLAMDEHTMVCLVNANGDIFHANRRVQLVTGFDNKELVGMDIRKLIDPSERGLFDREILPALQTKEVWNGEIEGKKSDSNPFFTAATFVSQWDSDDCFDAIICIQTDITAQKKAERTIQSIRASEKSIGAHIQRSLLIERPPKKALGYELSSYNEPSDDIDGDFIDVRLHSAGFIDIVVGDVMGKGVPAALLASATKMQLSRAFLEESALLSDGTELPRPSAIVSAVHRSLTPHLQTLDSFVTMSYTRLDLNRNCACFVGCGHTEPLILNWVTNDHRTIENTNLPVGILENEEIVESNFSLAPTELLLLYSDGLPETFNHSREQFGIERIASVLKNAIRSHRSINLSLQKLRQEIRNFSAGFSQPDDSTAIAIANTLALNENETSTKHMRQDLQWTLTEIGTIRDLLSSNALSMGSIQGVDVALMTLAVVEVFTNIVKHAERTLPESSIEIAASFYEDRIEFQLSYFSNPFYPSKTIPSTEVSSESECGYGMSIIESQFDHVEYLHNDGINTVLLKKLAVADRQRVEQSNESNAKHGGVL